MHPVVAGRPMKCSTCLPPNECWHASAPGRALVGSRAQLKIPRTADVRLWVHEDCLEMLNSPLTAAAEAAQPDRANQSPGFISTASWTAGERNSAWARLWATLFDAVGTASASVSEGGAA